MEEEREQIERDKLEKQQQQQQSLEGTYLSSDPAMLYIGQIVLYNKTCNNVIPFNITTSQGWVRPVSHHFLADLNKKSFQTSKLK